MQSFELILLFKIMPPFRSKSFCRCAMELSTALLSYTVIVGGVQTFNHERVRGDNHITFGVEVIETMEWFTFLG